MVEKYSINSLNIVEDPYDEIIKLAKEADIIT